MKMSKSKKICLIMVSFFCVICLVTSILGLNRSLTIKNNYVLVESTITRITEDEDVYVSFSVNEENYEMRLNEYVSWWKEGQKIKIYYNPTTLNDAYTESFLYIFPSITSVFAVILLIVDSVILISFLKQKSKFLRLAGEGNKIYAKIVNISKQNNVNGAPLTIECAYDNNGEVLFFNKKTNKLTNYNILNKKVAVYYNKNNTKDFYIDFNDIINV